MHRSLAYLPRKVVRLVLFSLLAAAGCNARIAADEYVRIPSAMLPADAVTSLSRALAPMERRHPGQSGFLLLPGGREAFLLRIAMIEAAERTLDLQYYSVRGDETGQLLLEALLQAADRGVRVRVLVDDLNLQGADETLAALNSHKHIEIRVFNPFATQHDSILTRLNTAITGLGHFTRRMHNKCFITDNKVAITGGRNLGDEYFDQGTEFNFHDMDIFAAGPITSRISRSFDQYWNDDESFPIAVTHTPQLDDITLRGLRAKLARHWRQEKEAGELKGLIPLAAQLERGGVKLRWARAELAADLPDKIDAPAGEAVSKPSLRINQMAQKAQKEFIIVSPYFVPGEEGMQWLQSLAARGIALRILTNSLASTDVVAVHAGYRKYRRDVIAAGMELYEMKPAPGKHPRAKVFSSGSRASLHSKLYVVDRTHLILGSYNFDPRSEHLNTEMVLVIHSPELSAQVVKLFEQAILPASSYRVEMEEGGGLEWKDGADGTNVHTGAEPEAGLWRRIQAGVFTVLPVESQL